MSSLPRNGCHSGHAFPWPYSDSSWSALLTSSFEAQLGSPSKERVLGLSLGCGPPLCDPAWTAYMESGSRTKLLTPCSKQGRARRSPEPALPRARMVPVTLCSPSSPQAPSGLRSGPGSIGLNFGLLPVRWLPLWTGLLSTGLCILKNGPLPSGRADLRFVGQTRRPLSGCVCAFLSIMDVGPEMEPAI